MKRIFILIISLLLSSSVFALGAGVQMSAKPSAVFPARFAVGEGVSGTFKMDRVPIVISGGIVLFHYDDYPCFGIDISGDYLFFENQIENIMNWYGGAGLSGNFLFDTDFNFSVKGGVRFLLGLNWHFYDGFLELYAQEVLSPEVIYFSSLNSLAFELALPLELGIRFHF